MTVGQHVLVARILPRLPGARGSVGAVVTRDLMAARRNWIVPLSGFFEPLFYLLSLGIGLGSLIGKIPGPGGHLVGYREFVAPALLASSAMNGGIFESANVFFKMKFGKIYDTMLATPIEPIHIALGEILYALMRGVTYSVGFLGVMLALGLIESPWALLALPAAVLIGFGFGACGTAAATYFRTWQDMEWMTLAVLPMFLFSTTFYPLSTYDGWLQGVVRVTPLYQGVALLRELILGPVGLSAVGHAAYFVAMGAVGLALTGRRIKHLLLT
ncbi:MAG: lipooligosaccharide transport system permease protein [Frankiales bacterium]|jgi:lipooligosaccharide transport system permease protein|nr:lipooligosaccharide transport system permease protein [Frankiales bacterium]